MRYSTTKRRISQIKEVYTKAEVHKYVAHLLSEDTVHCKKDRFFVFVQNNNILDYI